MWKRIGLIVLLVLSFSFSYSDIATAAGLKNYTDTDNGFEFLYPNGWVQVKVGDGPVVVFHDIIEPSENISVVISPVPDNKTLTELGTPGEVGYKLGKNALAPEGSGREAELINDAQREVDGKLYYKLEYLIKLPNNQKRHNLANVVVSRGKLFTFNASVTERRWPRVKRLVEDSIDSFIVY
ncbi:photosystem II oxygen evolving complex protein PsbP [Calothrix sp. PCC 7716]|nr:photosystem II oxygen evolving complex protein PsbP [Calothrix sp. PCC 7716]